MKPLARLLIATCLISSLSLPCLSEAAISTIGTDPAPKAYQWTVDGRVYSADGISGIAKLEPNPSRYDFRLTTSGEKQLIASTQLLVCLDWVTSALPPWATVNTKGNRPVVTLDGQAIGLNSQGLRELTTVEQQKLSTCLKKLDKTQAQLVGEVFRVGVDGHAQTPASWADYGTMTRNTTLSFVP